MASFGRIEEVVEDVATGGEDWIVLLNDEPVVVVMNWSRYQIEMAEIRQKDGPTK